ncbi:hypothetical protein [Nocardiopsis halotolerans]|uniref:hypothetical protein n=1 Tax=Nocardiopsis halotolerans TaxID=124252 RepID=UPI00036CD207|nr:hypothetical protein [Nocardiopsis halotolerans]
MVGGLNAALSVLLALLIVAALRHLAPMGGAEDGGTAPDAGADERSEPRESARD